MSTQQDRIWGDYAHGTDALKSFLWGLTIAVVGWGLVGVAAWVVF